MQAWPRSVAGIHAGSGNQQRAHCRQGKDSPFDGRQPKKGAIFVEPKLVGEVEFLEWTRTATLRAPSFKGLRDDKDPKAVVREVPEPPPG